MSQQLQPQSTETTTALLSNDVSEAAAFGIPARPIAGLPLRRIIPQDVHAIMDYAGGAACLAASIMSDAPSAKLTNAVLASASTGVSLLTDYNLSVAKVVPIEVHEVIDYVWGLGNVLSPFLFGYYRKEKLASTIQIAFGLGTIAASLVTDYRAVRGVTWGNMTRDDADGADGAVTERAMSAASEAAR
jgi:hypothetical protein